MNYTTTPSKLIIGGFDLKDGNGNLVAIAVGEKVANQIAHLPELLEALDAMLDLDLEFSYGRAKELQESLKPFRT